MSFVFEREDLTYAEKIYRVSETLRDGAHLKDGQKQ